MLLLPFYIFAPYSFSVIILAKNPSFVDHMLEFYERRNSVQLPPENLNKKFEPVNKESMESLPDDMKLLIQIYKLNMTNTNASIPRLEKMFDGAFTHIEVWNLITTLHLSREVITRHYGEIGNGRAGNIYFVREFYGPNVKQVYEDLVMPKERPEERISYVPDMLP